MDYRKATIAQLRFIAFEDECEAHYKYEAVREIQRRSFDDCFLPRLFDLRKEGWSVTEISKELDYDTEIIRWQLKKHRIYYAIYYKEGWRAKWSKRISNGLN